MSPQTDAKSKQSLDTTDAVSRTVSANSLHGAEAKCWSSTNPRVAIEAQRKGFCVGGAADNSGLREPMVTTEIAQTPSGLPLDLTRRFVYLTHQTVSGPPAATFSERRGQPPAASPPLDATPKSEPNRSPKCSKSSDKLHTC